jgi:predicted Zn-dependent protease
MSVTLDAPSPDGIHAQAEELAKQGRWKEAAAELDRVIREHPNAPADWWHHLAVATLNVGDFSGYRKICEKIAKTPAGQGANWTLHIGPNGLADYSEILDQRKNDQSRADLCSLGAFLYRAGEYQRAAKVLSPIAFDAENPHTDAGFYLAMALHKLGDKAGTARAMAAGQRLLNQPKIAGFWFAEQFKLQKAEAQKILSKK